MSHGLHESEIKNHNFLHVQFHIDFYSGHFAQKIHELLIIY